MRKGICAIGAAALLALLATAGCQRPVQEIGPIPKDYDRPLPPGQLALRKITDPAQVPDFTSALADRAGLREAAAFSLNYLAKPSSRERFPYGTITHEQAVASLQAFLALLDSGLTSAQLNQALRRQFDVYMSVGCDNRGTVLVTAYYTPIFRASLERTDRFRHPLYKPPAGLEKLPDGTPATLLPDRRAIETGGLYAGNELVWLADAFEAYVAQVQGSVRLILADGREMTVGYTANNGHEYKSVRAELVKDGRIGRHDGLPAMLAYFRAHPEDVTTYTWRNPRYIFFSVIEDGRPRGCLNEPVTPRRTVATDKKVFPPACLAMLSAPLPQRRGGQVVVAPWQGFALDQDSGGAIRAPGRCDLYLGIGPEAGDLAGRAQHEGRLYYLFLKPGGAPAAPLAPAAPAAAPPRPGDA